MGLPRSAALAEVAKPAEYSGRLVPVNPQLPLGPTRRPSVGALAIGACAVRAKTTGSAERGGFAELIQAMNNKTLQCDRVCLDSRGRAGYDAWHWR
jgi:hypothetical protein